MSFGLCKAPTTFQRAMTSAFQEYFGKFIEIFLDDFCICSSKDRHIECFTKWFEWCKEYGISINAAKSEFIVSQE